ncbi:MAG TPA: hypothetical protein VMV69_03475 [Pirellulales bacterium]|nr:hypothetical protein [Pirellulales bacterium]
MTSTVEPILDGLRNLHALFSNAPTLGSLIDPNQLSADLITADYPTLQPYLAEVMAADDRSHADRSHHAPRDGTVTRSVTSTARDLASGSCNGPSTRPGATSRNDSGCTPARWITPPPGPTI